MYSASICEWPGPLFTLAAFCRTDFDRLIAKCGATPLSADITSFGKRIDRVRHLFLSLAPGRYAALSKRDSQSDYEIGLQLVGKRFFEHELGLVSEFIGIPLEYIDRYRDPSTRWVSTTPTDTDREYWLKRIGTAYPYPDV